MKRINCLIFLVFFLAVGQLIFGLSKVISRTDLIDFRVYYEATLDFLNGYNPYQKLYYLKIPFNYPPSFVIFFAPFLVFGRKLSEIIWLTGSSFSLVLSSLLLFKLFIPVQRWPIKLLLISLLLQNFPTKFTLVMGQANMFVLLLIVASFYFFSKKKDKLSGLFLGLAAAFKVTPLILIAFFLAKRRYKSVVFSLMTFLLLNLIFIIPSLDVVGYYFKINLPALFKLENNGFYYDQSILAFFSRIHLTPALSRVINFLLLLGGLGMIWKRFKSKKDLLSELDYFSLILLWITVTSQFAWQHHFVFLFPAFLSASFFLIKKKNLLFGFILFISALLVGFHFRDPDIPLLTNPVIASHNLWGAFLLGGLLYLKPK